MSEIKTTITLNTGAEMPLLGLGVYKATGENEVEQAIVNAADIGYRLIDTASVYKNEEGVGIGIRSSKVSRKDLFVTTKVWNNAQRVGDIEGAFNRSLERLKLDYVDLYLIHWPVPGCYMDTWHEMEQIYRSGRAKAIGVSNFSMLNLAELAENSQIVPAVNQIEFHPLWNRSELVEYCQTRGIAVQAYAPLARGAYLDNPVLQPIAEKYNRSTAQIGLRWSIQKGVAVIPKSTRVDRILSNSQIFDFSLSPEEMSLIDNLNEDYRSSGIPEDMQDVIL
ncbi:MAG: aldo/keto reductase [Lachnospiraceae bacterium]|nr:aldo/keto reductase [Lachnospiraceae bacterium]